MSVTRDPYEMLREVRDWIDNSGWLWRSKDGMVARINDCLRAKPETAAANSAGLGGFKPHGEEPGGVR